LIGVGDFNNDSYNDFVLGADTSEGGCLNGTQFTGCGSGVVYLWNSTLGNFSFFGEFFGVDKSDNAGASVGVGDFNGDDYDDFVLGALNSEGGCVGGGTSACGSGVVYLYNATLGNFTFFGEFFGADTGDSHGSSVSTGDFNNDSFTDFVLGGFQVEGGCLNSSATNSCGGGVVYLWNTTLGNFTFLHEVFGVDDTDRAGRYYGVNVGDFNGDGYADLILGAAGADGGCLNSSAIDDCGSGVVYLWNVSTGNFSFFGEFFGSDDNDFVGRSIGVGDFNNDGLDDFVLGGDGSEGGCVNVSVTAGCGSGVVYLWTPGVSFFDFNFSSLAHNGSVLFSRLSFDESVVDSSVGVFYRFYLSFGGVGNQSSPESQSLPFVYDYYVEINGSVCKLHNATTLLSGCSFGNSTSEIELAVNFSDIGLSVGGRVNVTWEVANVSSRLDIVPDLDSYVEFTVGIPPDVFALAASPNPGSNGSVINVTVNVTDTLSISKVIGQLFYPNGSAWQNFTMLGGEVYNGTFTSPVSPLGNYTIKIFANDTGNNVNNSITINFIPFISTGKFENIVIDGSFADWENVTGVVDGDDLDQLDNFTFLGEFFGVDNSDFHGYSVGVGDFDNDGFDDFVLGGYQSDGGCVNVSATSDCGSGVVYLYNATLGNFSFFGEFFGVDDSDAVGVSVGVGDFNNDSFDDFVLSGNSAEGGCLNGSQFADCGSGVVYLWNTTTGNFSFFGEFFGVDNGDGAGTSAAVGDFNNDDYDDFVLGANTAEGGCLGTEGNSCGSGVVYLYNTSTGNFSFLGEFFGVDNGDTAGTSVDVGDFNNDSYVDFVLGGRLSQGGCLNSSADDDCGSGVVYLWNASLGNFTFFGEFFGVDNNDFAGTSVGVGDFNNDDYDDFVLGADSSEGGCLNGTEFTGCGSGVVYLYNASLGNFTFFGEFFGVDNNDRAGFSVGIGDFNNDSFDDFVLGADSSEGGCVGAATFGCGSGVVYLWNTTTGNFSFFGEFFGVDNDDFAGASVGVGDFNNDDYDDFVLGGYQGDGGCVNASATSDCGSGVVYLWDVPGSFDFNFSFVANDANVLFSRLSFDDSSNFSSVGVFYRFYLSGVLGNGSSPEGAGLPFVYDYFVEINGSVCKLHNATTLLSGCSFSSSSQDIELAVNLSDVGLSVGGKVNVTWETVSGSTRKDVAPDLDSYVEYTVEYDIG